MATSDPKKIASFSIRMTPQEREYLDALSQRYDRPRSWVIRKTVQVLAKLEKARRHGTLAPGEEAALGVLEKSLKQPIRIVDPYAGE